MSSLACLMHDLGYEVLGSDKAEHFFTEVELNKRNIKILEFNENNINNDMIIVKGNAFGEENVEVKKSIELGLKTYTYQSMISEVTKNYKLIAVSGCHGKTTTSTMLSKILEPLGVNYLIGDGSGYGKKDNKYFVLEACEYKRHFLEYSPYYSIITNIELDHTDYYKNLDDVKDAFVSFINNTKDTIIACGDDTNIRSIKTDKRILYYGFNDVNDVVMKNICVNDNKTTADVYISNKFYDKYVFPFVGDHLLLNVLSAITICYLENIDKALIKHQIEKIKPAKRRFIEEIIGSNVLIDDYAHHPTELKVTIEAARKKYPDKHLVAIFKPHTKSRVKFFAKDFANSLNLADEAYVMDIGEDRIEIGYDNVTSNDIIKYLRNGKHISLDEANILLQYKNTVLLFMSSKDIYVLEDKYKDLYKTTNK